MRHAHILRCNYAHARTRGNLQNGGYVYVCDWLRETEQRAQDQTAPGDRSETFRKASLVWFDCGIQLTSEVESVDKGTVLTENGLNSALRP